MLRMPNRLRVPSYIYINTGLSVIFCTGIMILVCTTSFTIFMVKYPLVVGVKLCLVFHQIG